MELNEIERGKIIWGSDASVRRDRAITGVSNFFFSSLESGDANVE